MRITRFAIAFIIIGLLIPHARAILTTLLVNQSYNHFIRGPYLNSPSDKLSIKENSPAHSLHATDFEAFGFTEVADTNSELLFEFSDESGLLYLKSKWKDQSWQKLFYQNIVKGHYSSKNIETKNYQLLDFVFAEKALTTNPVYQIHWSKDTFADPSLGILDDKQTINLPPVYAKEYRLYPRFLDKEHSSYSETASIHLFKNLPIPNDTKSLFLSSLTLYANPHSVISVFGKKLVRKPVPQITLEKPSKNNWNLNFPKIEDSNIVNNGFQLHFKTNVDSIEYFGKNGLTQTLKQNEKILLGKGLAFVFSIVNQGIKKTYIVNKADAIELKLNNENKAIVTIYSYLGSEHFVLTTDSHPEKQRNGLFSYNFMNHRNEAILQNTQAKTIQLSEITDLPAFYISHHKNASLATMVFTDHADYQELETEKLLNYGTQDLTQNKSASGLIGNGIQYTKSVFPIGETSSYKRSSGKQNYQMKNTTLSNSPKFKNLIKQLHKDDIEIGLHSISYKNLPPTEAEHAFKSMETFNPETWIDHGAVRSNIMWSGSDKRSPYYILDQLKRHNLKYIWADTDFAFTQTDSNFYKKNQASNILFSSPNIGDTKWRPHFFSATMLSWSNTSILTPEFLSSLLKDSGLVIWHTYFAQYAIENSVNPQGKREIKLKNVFKNDLKALSSFIRSGEIYNPTLKDWADYYLKSLAVSAYSKDKTLILESEVELIGFTIAMPDFKKNQIILNGKPIKTIRTYNNIKYFSLPLNEGKNIVIF